MSNLEKAKTKLFNNFPCHKLFHYDSSYGNFKDLKFHEGDDDVYFMNSRGVNNWMNKNWYDVVYSDKAEDYFIANYDRGQVLFSVDIAIFHKDYVKYIIDVVHEITIDRERLNRISNHFRDGIYYYQVLVDDILSPEVSELKNLEFTKMMSENYQFHRTVL